MKKHYLFLIGLLILGEYSWVRTALPSDLEIGEAYELGDIPSEIIAIQSNADNIKLNLETFDKGKLSERDRIR